MTRGEPKTFVIKQAEHIMNEGCIVLFVSFPLQYADAKFRVNLIILDVDVSDYDIPGFDVPA